MNGEVANQYKKVRAIQMESSCFLFYYSYSRFESLYIEGKNLETLEFSRFFSKLLGGFGVPTPFLPASYSIFNKAYS